MSGVGHDNGDKPLSETFDVQSGEEFEEQVSLEGDLNATAKALMAHEKERLARESEQKQKQKDIRDGLAAGAPVSGLALVSALWARYCTGQREDGSPVAPNDPAWNDLQQVAIKAKGWAASLLFSAK